jgi:hypothetical protein
VRQVCESCRGLKKIAGDVMARDGGVTDQGVEPVSESEDAVEKGRPMTVRPPFDPAEFARREGGRDHAGCHRVASFGASHDGFAR